MELGMIGLGRMGANMTERLVRGGHRLISYDRSTEAVQRVMPAPVAKRKSSIDWRRFSPRWRRRTAICTVALSAPVISLK
jgi:6-phosphogluconate dehydrogenase (decarboxylating)